MKKRNVFVILLLVSCLMSCDKKAIIIDDLDADSNNYPLTDNKSVCSNEENTGFYFIQQDPSEIYYLEDNTSKIRPICLVNYADKKPAGLSYSYTKYLLLLDHDVLLKYGDYFYFMYHKFGIITGDESYLFSRISIKTQKKEDLHSFSDKPTNFFIQHGVVYFVETSLDSEGKKYSQIWGLENDFKVVLPYSITNCLVSGDYVYYDFNDENETFNNRYSIGRINLATGDFVTLSEGKLETIFNNYLAIKTNEANPSKSKIINLDNDETILEFSNERIDYFDNETIVTSKLSGDQEYRKYDYQGNLQSTIFPDKYFIQTSSIDTTESNFSEILSYHQNIFMIKIIIKSRTTYLRCNYNDNSCEIVELE